MRLERKARLWGQGKNLFVAYSGSSIGRHGLERQPRGIHRNKRGGRSGQITRIKRGHEPGALVYYATPNQVQNCRNIRSQNDIETRNARNYHFERSKRLRKGGPISYSKTMQPLKRGGSVAVVKVAADEAMELVEGLWSGGVGIKAPFHLCEKLVEHAGEVGGRGAVSDDCFHNHFLEGSFPTSDPDVGREALGTLVIAHNYNVCQGSSYAPNELLYCFRSSYSRAERQGDNSVDFAQVDSDMLASCGSDVSAIKDIIDLIDLLLSSVVCRRRQREGEVSSEFTTGKRVQLLYSGRYAYERRRYLPGGS